MRRELQQIPPAPRIPRWPPVLWARWPLAFLAFVGAVYGGVITLMFFYAWGGQPADDALLDRLGSRADGTIIEVEPRDAPATAPQMARVRYQFQTAPARTMDGEMYLPATKYTVGAPVDVDFVADRPHVNRIVGERLSRLRNVSQPLWRWFVMPGLAALVLWLLGVLRTRHLLRHGDVGIADLRDVRPLPFVLPGMLRVTYSFRDHRARERRGQ